MKKIKILFTIPNFDTAGSGKVVYDLVNRLDKTVFVPEICVFHKRGAFFKEVEKLTIPIHVFQFTTPYKPLTSFLFRVWEISKFFKKHQFDIIHSWHWSSDFSEPLAAKLAGIPFVYTKKAMGWGNKSWIWRSKLSTRVIAINQDMMIDFFSEMKNNVVKLPLGVDTEYYKPQNKSLDLQQQLGIEQDDFVIVSVVNMVPVKGIEILLNAVNLINDKRIKVFIIGNDKSEYAVTLKEIYNNNSFQFLGKKLDVRPFIALADVFVIPTKNEGRKEGMPIAPLEAMAMGVPVIGSEISGIKDILEDYPQFLFIPSDEKDLANKIKKLKADTNFDNDSMVSMIQNKFSINSFIEARQELYIDIIQ